MILDSILKIFEPVFKFTFKNYENNYLFYALGIAFIALLALVFWLIVRNFI